VKDDVGTRRVLNLLVPAGQQSDAGVSGALAWIRNAFPKLEVTLDEPGTVQELAAAVP
jgi:hypothetical protein